MRRMTVAVLILGAWAFSGCAGKATPDEIDKMCEHYGHMTGTDQVPAKADLVADVERMFSGLQKDVKASHDLELKQVQEDITARIAAAKDDAEKTSLQENLDAKTKQLEEKLALDLAAFDPRKAEELAKVDAKIKTAEADRVAALKKCVDKANADGITSSLAQCRIGAQTVDKYNTVCY
jgi:hypothetical protein